MKLVPLSFEYLEFWHKLHNDPETRRHQPIEPTTLAQQREMLLRFEENDLDNILLPSYKWVVIPGGNSHPVGIVSYHRVQIDQGIGRVGYSILPEFWNKGIASQAVKSLVDLLFSRTNAERLEAVCSIHNPASRRVLEKAGFTYEGVKYGYLKIRDERVDHFSFGFLKSGWPSPDK